MKQRIQTILLVSMVWVIVIGCSDEKSGDTTSADGDSSTDPSDGTDGTDNISTDSNSDPIDGWVEGTDSTVVVGEGGELLVDGDGQQFVCYKTMCDGRLLECGDCIDNDGDGATDWRDQECLGPCDNTEGPALISDVGGVTGSTCHVDCYFDYGNGMGTGSDDCWWSHECDPLEPEEAICEYNEDLIGDPQFCPDEQTQLCTDICVPFTPNGCDCFGCCTFPELTGLGEDGDDAYVWIGAKDENNVGTCTFADILDETLCPRCTPVGNCLNECAHCEICIGKPELPADCLNNDDGDTDDTDDTDNNNDSDNTSTEQCAAGLDTCTIKDISPCDPGFYCVSGCCQPTTIAE